jgi:hypothetical protein
MLQVTQQLATFPTRVANEVTKSVMELTKLSTQTGLAVQDLSRLQYVAAVTEANVGGLAQAMRSLSAAMVGTAEDGSKTDLVFGALGVEVTDSAGKYRDLTGVFLDVAAAINALPTAAERMRVAQVLLGRGALDLLPIFNTLDRDGLQQLMRRSDELGNTFSPGLVRKAQELDDATDELGASFQGLKNDIAEGVIPKLSAFNRWLSEVILRYRELREENRLMSLDEAIAEEKRGVKYRGSLWRDPPIIIGAPTRGPRPGERGFVGPTIPVAPAFNQPGFAGPNAIDVGNIFAPGTGPGQQIEPPGVLLPGTYAWWAAEQARKDAEAAQNARWALQYDAQRRSRTDMGPGAWDMAGGIPQDRMDVLTGGAEGASPEEIRKQFEELDQAAMSPWEHAREKMIEFGQSGQEIFGNLKGLAQSLGEGLVNTFAGAKIKFGEFFTDFLKKIGVMIARALILAAIMAFLPGGGGAGSFMGLFKGFLGIASASGGGGGGGPDPSVVPTQGAGDFSSDPGSGDVATSRMMATDPRADATALLSSLGARLDSSGSGLASSSSGAAIANAPPISVIVHEATPDTWVEITDTRIAPRLRERDRMATVRT